MDEPVIKFLDEEFFGRLIAKRLPGEQCHLVSHTVSNITGKGEGYQGTIYRGVAKVLRNGITDELDFIIKVSAGDKNLAACVSGPFKPYEKEITVYRDILPVFENFYQTQKYKFAPTCYETLLQPFEMLIMENLKPLGYVLGPTEGFDLQHSVMTVKQMARFHAVSVKYVEEIGMYSEFLRTTGVYAKFIKKFAWGNFVNNLFQTFRNILKQRPDFVQISDKLDLIGDNLLPHLTAATDLNSSDFCVLNHGDLWNFNILFKYEGTEPCDVTFIDYQLCSYNTFAQDFLFFVTSSIQGSKRELFYDVLVEAYQNELEKCLKELNYSKKVPTLEDIHSELIRKSVLAIAAFVESYAISELDKNFKLNFELVLKNNEEGEEHRRKVLNNPKVIETARYYLPFLMRKGMLDLQAPK